MNIKSKFSILVAIIFSLSFGLVTLGHADGHGHGMNVPKIEVTTVLSGLENNPWTQRVGDVDEDLTWLIN